MRSLSATTCSYRTFVLCNMIRNIKDSKKSASHTSSTNNNNSTNNIDKSTNLITIHNKQFPIDDLTTVTPTIIEKVGRNIHLQHNHPIEIIKRRITNHFSDNYFDSNGLSLFNFFDDLSPIVTIEQNFDSLLIPPGHASRIKCDNYFINRHHMLRAHTSAHQLDFVRSGYSNFLVTGDVYRRDEIDRKHYPIFHQMEGVQLFTHESLQLTCPEILDTEKLDTDYKQAEYTLAATQATEKALKATLLGVVECLFGSDIESRWTDTYFPFTHPSFELEIFWSGDWLEVLGSGIMRHKILSDGGFPNKIGYAFGLGLERLAMILYGIPDVRLFWTTDIRFLEQFQNIQDINEDVKFIPFPKYPSLTRDFSFWIKPEFVTNDFFDILRNEGGDVIAKTELIDEYIDSETQIKSLCFRISYGHLNKTYTNREITLLHERIKSRMFRELPIIQRY